MYLVAPLVGAWIEIRLLYVSVMSSMSLPSWERGLKYYTSVIDILKRLSLPSWERGLKSDLTLIKLNKDVRRSPRGSVD